MGVTRRDITCIWKGTNETAGEGACRKRNHPESVTTCHRDSLKFECKDKEDLNSQPDKTVVENRISDSLHSGMNFILHNFKEDFRVLITSSTLVNINF